MTTTEEVKRVLAETLQLGERAANFDESTRLLEDVPELDSMAIVSLITTLEERFGFSVDDEIDAEAFETLGSLVDYVNDKLNDA